MGPDLFADITLLLGFTVGAVAVVGRMLRGVESRLREDLKAQIASVREENALGQARLESQIGAVRAELGDVEQRLNGRIDGVRDELVQTRVALADRVARLEGRVFGDRLRGTGTDVPRA